MAGIAFWKKDKELEDKLGGVLDKFKDNKNDLIFEAEVFYGEGDVLEKDLEEMLLNLKEENLKEELSHKMRELYLIKEDKDNPKSAEIMKEIKEINEEIQNIKNNRTKK